MKRVAIAVLLLTFAAEPALVHAQQDNSNRREQEIEKKKEQENPLLREYHEKQKENAKIEQRYERVLRATDSGTAPAKVDPWAKLRGGNASKR